MIDNSQHWLLFHQPIEVKPGSTVSAQAIRIGYKPSITVTKEF
jgi:hypothetical protein